MWESSLSSDDLILPDILQRRGFSGLANNMTDKKAVLLGLGRRVKMDVHPNTGKCNIESFWGGGWLVAVEEESCEAIRD
jgi:hypothetical protein